MQRKIADQYFKKGEEKAYALPNRGPIRFTEDGAVHPDILSAYWRYGFYVLKGLIQQGEVDNLVADFNEVMDRAPKKLKNNTRRQGQAIGSGAVRARNFSICQTSERPYGWNRLNGRSVSNKNEIV